MSLKIISADKDRIAEIAEVEKQCFSQPWSEQSLFAEVNKENAVILIALNTENTVVGWAGLEYIFGEGSVMNIAVLPQYRRQGVGDALTRALLKTARKLLLDWLILEVRISNIAAISLYRKLGFDTIGIRPDFYESPREDAVIMRHMLD